ncbi:addiction module antidote protein [Salinisphaera sp. LB1]|uniref:addiction module antidote protein n=1 Tax=Salinisphaera sp. LB1 TaxID=2183911 RepID=UPI0021018F75|nr:addiction module antidote protein [Salinisphaera sp. LB1]
MSFAAFFLVSAEADVGIELTNYDPADYLDSPEMMAAYLNAAIEASAGDAAAMAEALGAIARAKGMSDVAEKAGLGRQSLYKALSSDGNPSLDTIARVAAVLGLRVSVAAA